MDTERFAEYYNEAVTAVVFAVHRMNKPILCGKINACWREELLDNRFCSVGIRHGAAVWLEQLEAEDPQRARRLIQAMEQTSLRVGVGPVQAGVGAAGAAAVIGGALLGAMDKTAKAARFGRAAAGVLGLGLLGKSGVDAAQASDPERVSALVREQAQAQLEELLAILRD
ncbi:MAG: hypothetical protein J6M47_04630 [Clostridia bacterium]|nr:hypothetical protein [Clostridia bacterium]